MVEKLGRRAFIGRHRELARLVGMLDAAASGAGRTVVVGGDAGVGKTRLVERLAEVVVERARVLEGACLESRDGGVPYAPIVEILRGAVESVPEGHLAAILGPGRAELTRLLPEIAPRALDVRPADGADATAQARLFELIVGVLERLARERPLVVVVEDVQWADHSTRELLGLASRALRDEPALLVLTVRTDARAAVAGQLGFLAELERDEHVERLDLGPFERGEVMEQLSALMGGEPRPDLVDRILARSDGNPFYVEELVRAGATDGQDLPSVLRDVLGVRISALSRPARDILRAAAAAGRRIDDELLAAATAVSPPELAGALREAVDAGILVRSGSGDAATSTFRHALLQEVVDGELFPAERTALHAAFARALEARAATDGPSASPAELARHWDAAGEPARALGPMVDAARAAEQVYAWPEALRLWERARELFERVPRAVDVVGSPAVELTARAAECALLAGDYGRAVTLGRAAVEGIDERSDPTAAGDLHTRLRWYLWEAGDRAGAAWAVEEALRLIPASPPSRARARALAHQAGVLMFAGRYEASIRAASEAIEMGRTTGAVREAALALGILGWDLAATGDVEGGLARFLEGRRVAESLGRAEGIALAITNHVALLDRIGRSEDALAAARQGYAEIRRLGVARTYGGVLLGYAAKAELALGRWDDAERSTSQGLRAGGSDRAELWLLVQRGRLLTWRGAFAEAAVLLGRARSIVDRQPASEFATALLEAEGELAAEQGDLASLHRVAAAGLAMLASGAPADPPLARLATVVVRGEADARALADVAPGRRDEAGATVIEQVDAAIRAALGAGSLAAGARGAVILAQLDAERGRLAGRTDVDAWRAVAEGWAAAGRPYPTAFARFREAEATLAAGGGRSDAVAMLRDARAVAVALGAAPLRERIDRLARAARLVVEEDAPQPAADPFGFTARELEVLPLLAAGWTNQQIGDALFITRKTASVHVSNIMAKLDVEHRAEAAATAHRLGLVRGGPIGR